MQLGILAVLQGRLDEAPALLAAALELSRAAHNLRAWPHLGKVEAELVAQIRQQLGADPFDQAFSAGAALTQQQALALARLASRHAG